MSNRGVSNWLLLCYVMVFGMIIVGGVTRLTQSGLSMVKWEPILGILPPLNIEQWQASFSEYKLFPEYQQLNKGMSLNEYKQIYLWEYLHRLLARMVGFVFFVPLLFFAYKKRIKDQLLVKLIAVFLLGAAQGLMGWYMVKSGLVDNPHVSQYRLVAHLSLAVIIYALLYWFWLNLNKQASPHLKQGPGHHFIKWVIGLISLMIISGGFMAGTKAGYIFNTFPKMGSTWLPEQLLALSPLWQNFFENTITIQFQHRLLALVTLTTIILFFSYMYKNTSSDIKLGIISLLILGLVQVGLGIVTLVSHVPVMIASMHQIGAILLLSAAIYTASAIKHKPF